MFIEYVPYEIIDVGFYTQLFIVKLYQVIFLVKSSKFQVVKVLH